MQKTALITGVSGQDGAYLSKLLLDKGYKVYGGVRRSSANTLWRLEEMGIAKDVEIVQLDLFEQGNILDVVRTLQPTELYNLAAQAFVSTSFEQPLLTADIDALGVVKILEAIRLFSKHTKFYQASTSEMFGKVQETPQTENTPFYPRSPYSVAKLYGHWITINYRESYNLYACCGILFNHESPFRGLDFVTRKITDGLAKIKHGMLDVLELGNLDARRDWGHTQDFVKAMYLMLQQDTPEDYVIATGTNHSVQEFVDLSASAAGFELVWKHENEKKEAIDCKTGKTIVKVNPKFFRPAEVDTLLGNPAKAKTQIGWQLETSFESMVEEMMTVDEKRIAMKKHAQSILSPKPIMTV